LSKVADSDLLAVELEGLLIYCLLQQAKQAVNLLFRAVPVFRGKTEEG